MSFMFNPHPYDDNSAINRPELSKGTIDSVINGTVQTAQYLSTVILEQVNKKGNAIIALESYISANPKQIVNLITQNLSLKAIAVHEIYIDDVYKPASELEKQFEELLPTDRERDPVLLYGKLFKGDFEELFDSARLEKLVRKLEGQKNTRNEATIVYGSGSATKALRKFYDYIVYFDVTPKQVVLRAKGGLFKNLGDEQARPFKELMRRAYYVDLEVASHLRGELFKQEKIDYYIISNDQANLKLIPKNAINEIMAQLSKYPFRCKPVYIEGIWGGEYVRKVRNLPQSMKNAAWVFDLIPLEVSILVEAGSNLLEFPYFTFVQKEGKTIMGEQAAEKFNGYFPIRFNYDDTFHSSGNMSIQVHPGAEYARENYGEHGRQDESYYVVATGHGAKTYCGLTEEGDPDEFIQAVKKSEKDFTPVDYDKYVNAVPSTPGVRLMLPSGTIHASGRNQLILEIGSLSVGSYTYKLYDYLRADLDGIPRPIHTYDGEKVLVKERKANWVKENIVQQPRLVRCGKGWAEYIVGEHDLLYFSLRRFEFEKEIEDDTNGKFHVLALVDGEQVVVQSVDNPKLYYKAGYLDVVVVPSSVGKYKVINLGAGPVVMHKTCLKDRFYEEE